MRYVKELILVLVLFVPTLAVGQQVSYSFEGTLNNSIGSLPAGAVFQGSITYSTASPELQGAGDPAFGLYALDQFEVAFGSEFIRISCCTINIDNRPTFDQIAVQSLASIGPVQGGVLGGINFSTTGQFDLTLADLSATALSSDALPGPGLSLSDFPLNPALSFFESGSGLFVQGTLTSFESQPVAQDTDGDGTPDDIDTDDDNDGVADDFDNDPIDPLACRDVDGDTCDDCSVQVDGFGPLPDFSTSNDGVDSDGDGLCDAGDPMFNDWDGDGIPDLFDPDNDNDGVLAADDVDDLDPFVCEDRDNDTCDDCSVQVDGFGPLPDFNPLNDGPATDGDGMCDAGDTNTDDMDGDGIVDIFDNCPTVPNVDQADSNLDGFGDACVPPDTVFGNNVTVGDNPVFGLGTTLRKDVVIGANATLGDGVELRRGVELGDYVSIGDQSIVRKGVQIGNNVSIGSNTRILKNVVIEMDARIGDGTIIRKDVLIGAGAEVGNNVVIRQGATIIPGAVVPDGAVVEKNSTYPAP